MAAFSAIMRGMNILLSIAITTGILSGIWGWVAVSLGLLSWAGFLGCTAYFACPQGGLKGLAISAATLLSGVVWAMVIIYGNALAPQLRHGKKDFFTWNMDGVLKTVEKTTRTLQLFLTLVAVISLVVGGIGVRQPSRDQYCRRSSEYGICNGNQTVAVGRFYVQGSPSLQRLRHKLAMGLSLHLFPVPRYGQFPPACWNKFQSYRKAF